MRQPTRKKKKVVEHITGTGKGLDYCDECPFITFVDDVPVCVANDVELSIGNDGKIIVPDWCGNKREE